MEGISILWLVGAIGGILYLIFNRDSEHAGKLVIPTIILIFLFFDSLDLTRYSKQIETAKFYIGWVMLFGVFVYGIAGIITYFDRFKFKHKEVVITVGVIAALVALMIALN